MTANGTVCGICASRTLGAASTEATPPGLPESPDGRLAKPWSHDEAEAYNMGYRHGREHAEIAAVTRASTEATERPDLRATFDLMSSEWEEYVNGLPTLPEESHDIPWPIRNFVRRARAALTEGWAAPEEEREPWYAGAIDSDGVIAEDYDGD